MPMPTTSMVMPTSSMSMGSSGSMWPTSSMSWPSSMATGSMTGSGMTPVYTGGTGKLAANVVGAIGATLMGVGMAV